MLTTTAEPTAAEAPEPTTLLPQPIVSQPFPEHEVAKGSMFLNVLRTTDHKLIGRMYLVTSFLFFFLGGAMALLMRAELARPGMQFLSPEQYNQLFTMHGTIMLLFFATPLVFAFANLVLPLQIGSPDVAFPRLNAFSYWLYPVRRADRHLRLRHPRRRGGRRLDVLHAAQRRAQLARRRHTTCGSSVWVLRVWARSSAAST